MDYIGYIIIGLIVALALWITFGSRRKKWYKVYTADNKIMLLQRDIKERWWRTSDRYMRFMDEWGKEWTFPSNAHWVLYWVEVPENELETVRDEIMRIRQQETKSESE